MSFEIIPTKGFDKLIFGMSKDQVKEILGEPSEIEIDNEDGEVTEHWHYDEIETSLLFSKDHEFKLLSIATSNPSSKIQGEKLIGLTETEMLDVLERIDADEDLEYEDVSSDEFPDHILVYCYDLAMNIWLDNGKVTELQWGPISNEEDIIEWPN